MIDIKDMYSQLVVTKFPNFKQVVLPVATLQQIEQASEALAREKLTTEASYKKDGASLKTRFKTGFKGEAAVEILLGINVMDFTKGPSTTYDHPDIEGYTVGVKTVRYGNFPVVPKHNEYAQIICIVDPTNDAKVYICGLATKEDLNMYQSDALILDDNLREKGTKTGYYGFNALKPVTHINDIYSFKI